MQRLSEKSLVQSDKVLIGEAKIPSGLNHDDDKAVGRLRERLGFIVMLHQPLWASKTCWKGGRAVYRISLEN